MNRSNFSNSTRKSGIELLKIFAIILICAFHCIQTAKQQISFPNTAGFNFGLLTIKMLEYGGTIGNLIFVICSSFFLIDSKRVKKEKAINILLDSQSISIIFLLVFIVITSVIKFSGALQFDTVIKNIFPDLFAMVWFVPAYVILYIAHPYLNRIIHSFSQKEHFAVCLCIFIFFGLFKLVCANPLVYDKGLINFVFIYFIVAYLKLYCESIIKNKKYNLIVFFSSFLLFVLIVFMQNSLSPRFGFISKYPHIDGLTSVIFIPMVLSLFNISLISNFKSKLINYISSCSLFVYCIHENSFIKDIVRSKAFNIISEKISADSNALSVLLLTSFVLFFSFIAAIVYKMTIHRITYKLSPSVGRVFTAFVDRQMIHFHKSK